MAPVFKPKALGVIWTKCLGSGWTRADTPKTHRRTHSHARAHRHRQATPEDGTVSSASQRREEGTNPRLWT